MGMTALCTQLWIDADTSFKACTTLVFIHFISMFAVQVIMYS